MHSTPLFDAIPDPAAPPQVPEIVTRRRAIDRAFDRADAAFLAEYERFLKVYGSIQPDFIAGEVTDAYVKRHHKLNPSQKKALGGLFQRLMRDGVISKTGSYRARNQGNPSAIYRLVKGSN